MQNDSSVMETQTYHSRDFCSARTWQKDMGDFRFSSDCAAHNGKSLSEISSDRKQDVADSCSQMILQLQDVYDPEKVNVGIKIVPRSPDGIIAANSVKLESK
ncbi:hypothetical protein V6N13_107306 [Hibiscus sabdariffa]